MGSGPGPVGSLVNDECLPLLVKLTVRLVKYGGQSGGHLSTVGEYCVADDPAKAAKAVMPCQPLILCYMTHLGAQVCFADVTYFLVFSPNKQTNLMIM